MNFSSLNFAKFMKNSNETFLLIFYHCEFTKNPKENIKFAKLKFVKKKNRQISRIFGHLQFLQNSYETFLLVFTTMSYSFKAYCC